MTGAADCNTAAGQGPCALGLAPAPAPPACAPSPPPRLHHHHHNPHTHTHTPEQQCAQQREDGAAHRPRWPENLREGWPGWAGGAGTVVSQANWFVGDSAQTRPPARTLPASLPAATACSMRPTHLHHAPHDHGHQAAPQHRPHKAVRRGPIPLRHINFRAREARYLNPVLKCEEVVEGKTLSLPLQQGRLATGCRQAQALAAPKLWRRQAGHGCRGREQGTRARRTHSGASSSSSLPPSLPPSFPPRLRTQSQRRGGWHGRCRGSAPPPRPP